MIEDHEDSRVCIPHGDMHICIQVNEGRVLDRAELPPHLDTGKIYMLEAGQLRQSSMLEGDCLTLIPTLACNESCMMCPQQKEESRMGRVSALVARNTDYSCVRQVYITGGEPYLSGPILEELVGLIPDDVEVSILTNGTLNLLDSPFLLRDRLRFCVPLYASISGIHNRIVGFRGFYKTVTNLFHLGNNGVVIELRNVITKVNYKNLPLYAHYVYNNLPFVANVAFMGIELMESAKDNADELWVDPDEYLPFLGEAVEYLVANGINCNLFNMPLCAIPQEMRQWYSPSISPWKRAYSEKCRYCGIRNQCGGMFFSSLGAYEKSISPLAKS